MSSSKNSIYPRSKRSHLCFKGPKPPQVDNTPGPDQTYNSKINKKAGLMTFTWTFPLSDTKCYERYMDIKHIIDSVNPNEAVIKHEPYIPLEIITETKARLGEVMFDKKIASWSCAMEFQTEIEKLLSKQANDLNLYLKFRNNAIKVLHECNPSSFSYTKVFDDICFLNYLDHKGVFRYNEPLSKPLCRNALVYQPKLIDLNKLPLRNTLTSISSFESIQKTVNNCFADDTIQAVPEDPIPTDSPSDDSSETASDSSSDDTTVFKNPFTSLSTIGPKDDNDTLEEPHQPDLIRTSTKRGETNNHIPIPPPLPPRQTPVTPAIKLKDDDWTEVSDPLGRKDHEKIDENKIKVFRQAGTMNQKLKEAIEKTLTKNPLSNP